MKVLCIDTVGIGNYYKKYTSFELKENEVYEPLGEKTDAGLQFWLIYNGPECQLWYKKSRFIPLSDIDEKTVALRKQIEMRMFRDTVAGIPVVVYQLK